MKRPCCRCARIMRWSHPTPGSMGDTCANIKHWDTCQQELGTAFPATLSIHTRTGALEDWLNTWGRRMWRRNILNARKGCGTFVVKVFIALHLKMRIGGGGTLLIRR